MLTGRCRVYVDGGSYLFNRDISWIMLSKVLSRNFGKLWGDEVAKIINLYYSYERELHAL